MPVVMVAGVVTVAALAASAVLVCRAGAAEIHPAFPFAASLPTGS